MPGLHRPGVYVSEVNTLGTTPIGNPTAAAVVFVGQTYKGDPTQAVMITSWNDFVVLYGGFANTSFYLPFAVWEYFNNGGAMCYVLRVVSSAGAVAATASLGDRQATPVTTLTITAENVGAWGNNIYVQTLDRSTDRFDFVIYNGGTADGNVVERWPDLSMNPSDPRYVVNVIQSVASGSNYIQIADAHDPAVSPTNRPAIATVQLSAGSDGTVPVTADYTLSFNQLDAINQSMVLSIPGMSVNATLVAAIAYATNRGDTFVVADPSQGLTPTAAITEASALTTTSYCAYYYPWLNAIDPSTSTPGATRLLPPSGAVCGVIAHTDLISGPYKAPAGYGAKLAGFVSLERKLSTTDLDNLNDGYVNAIRQHSVNGIVIMGARTLYKSTPTRYVPVRRSLIYLKDNLKALTEFAIFENNDATLWSSINDKLTQFLTAYWTAGGLRGETSAEAFYVLCDSSNNTVVTINAGEVHIEVGVAVEVPAEFIILNIGQWSGGSSATES